MDSFINEKDFALLAQDKYTFSVVDRILRGDCELIRTDHDRLLLCSSEKRYPVWVWTPDGITEAEKERAWQLAAETCPLSAGYRYNMKYELAEFFMAKGREAGMNIGYYMQLFTYDCPEPSAPDHMTDGYLHRCTQQDLEEAAALVPRFFEEIGEEAPPYELCLEKVREKIDSQAFFFWKTDAGKTTACCGYRCNEGLATLGPVYTLPEERRKHYAQHLVYRVTELVKEAGYMPMLYTDANYTASNACYEKIGYVLRGKLCTIAEMK